MLLEESKYEKSFRNKYSDIPTSKQTMWTKTIKVLFNLYFQSFKGISVQFFDSVLLCMRHPLRIGLMCNFDPTTPNHARVGIQITHSKKDEPVLYLVDQEIRGIDIFELGREILNHPGDFSDSTSHLQYQGDYVPQDMESMFLIKTILKQTFSIFHEDSSYNHVFSAMILTAKILSQQNILEDQNEDIKITLNGLILLSFIKCCIYR